MSYNGFSIPIVRYYKDSLILYDQNFDYAPRTVKQIENQKNLTRGHYNGYMSPKTKSKIRKYLSTWINAVQELNNNHPLLPTKKAPYLTFVTLTLPSKQMDEDNEIKRKCLMPFIQTLQRKHNVWNYFWRAEAQENGNIHFHLLIDSYVHHSKIRSIWNKTLEPLHYIHNFWVRHGHHNPNSTDIHALQNVHSVEAYIIKYCSKVDGYRQISGRVHGCSDRVRVLTPYESAIDDVANEVIKESKQQKTTEVYEGDRFQIIKVKVSSLNSPAAKKFKSQIKAYYLNTAIDLYSSQVASAKEVEQAAKIEAEEDFYNNFQQLVITFDFESMMDFGSRDDH